MELHGSLVYVQLIFFDDSHLKLFKLSRKPISHFRKTDTKFIEICQLRGKKGHNLENSVIKSINKEKGTMVLKKELIGTSQVLIFQIIWKR